MSVKFLSPQSKWQRFKSTKVSFCETKTQWSKGDFPKSDSRETCKSISCWSLSKKPFFGMFAQNSVTESIVFKSFLINVIYTWMPALGQILIHDQFHAKLSHFNSFVFALKGRSKSCGPLCFSEVVAETLLRSVACLKCIHRPSLFSVFRRVSLNPNRLAI